MTRRPTFTQAELDRAMRAAEKHGRVVEIVRGVIRIVDGPHAMPAPYPDEDGGVSECDRIFGVSD